MQLVHQSEEIIADKYRIIDILGQGSSGTTYKAQDFKTGKEVALKVLSLSHTTDWKTLELFEREVKILSQLNHPAIPHYLEYFQVDTAKDRDFYIAQQLAEGKSLAAWVESGWRTDENGVRQIAIQLLNILVYLHNLKPPVIHRDIKPHNIIRRDDGQIFLVDFGAVQDTYHNTFMRGSTVVGTYGYMAPEQFRGQAVPTTDLYGLGATLLFLLTHRSPGDLPTDRLKIDFRSRVQVSPEFADWLEKMLEPDVEDRFSSAKKALAVLQGKRIISSKPHQSVSWKVLVGLGVAVVVSGSVLNYYKYALLNSFGITPSTVFTAATDRDVNTVRRYLVQGGKANSKNEDGDTLLHWAVWNNWKDVAELLIAKGADLNAKNSIGQTPLHWSVFFDRKNMAELLIAKGADLNVKNSYGETPVQFAARNYGKNVAELLIAKGADLNVKNSYGETLLHLAVKNNWKNVAELLIAKGADVNAESIGSYSYTPLHLAVSHNWKGMKDIPELLIAKGADVNVKNSYGETPLHWAARINRKDVAELLIAKGADLNVKNNYGETPLHLAATNNGKNVAQLLIAKGTDLNAKSIDSYTPLHLAAWNNGKDVAELLIAKGADLNAKNKYGETPLHWATLKNGEDVAELLIAKGADLNAKNKYGETPLHLAAWNDRRDVAELLIAKGADLNAKSKDSYTPLHLAAWNNVMYMAELLIAKGADLNAKNKYGETPLKWAARNNGKNVAELLKIHGAKE